VDLQLGRESFRPQRDSGREMKGEVLRGGEEGCPSKDTGR